MFTSVVRMMPSYVMISSSLVVGEWPLISERPFMFLSWKALSRFVVPLRPRVLVVTVAVVRDFLVGSPERP